MRKNSGAWVCLVALAQLFFGTYLLAQTSKGIVAGRVVDSGGGVLKGAKIELQPGEIQRVSDEQGEFFVTGVDAGSYTVKISYVGLETYSSSMEVRAGDVARVDAVLKVVAASESVIVTAERAAGEAEAINRERTADNVLQVLPNEVIRSLPNANMADAIGRLPSVTLERDEGEGKYVQIRGTEPRLTNVTIDGVNVPSPESGIRQIKLDTIPADLVESVEINKTLQANQDGDGIGGSVNLVTKTAGERPTISLSGMGGYTPIVNGRGVVETTATVGQRFGTQKRFGILVGGSYDWNGRGIDDIEPTPDLAADGSRTFDSIDLREYRYHRSRWGLGASADYKLGEGSSLYARLLYSDFKNFGDRWAYGLNNGDTPGFNVSNRVPDYAIGSLLVGGKHVLSSSWVAWDLSVSRSRQLNASGNEGAKFKTNDTFDADFPGGSTCAFDAAATTSKYRPQWTPSCFEEAYNPANFDLDNVATTNGLTAQLNLQATAAYGKRYHLGSHTAAFEFGGKFRNAHKFDNSYTTVFDANSSAALAQFVGHFSNKNFYDGSYPFGPAADWSQVKAYFLANPGNFSVDADPGDPDNGQGGNPANFGLTEKVSAGYLMNTIDFSRIRIVAGVRFEGTNLDTVSWDSTAGPILPDGVPRGALTAKANGSYLKVLPSASIRFALTNETNLRLAYGRGLSRPDPQSIAQALTIDNSASPVLVSLGNPSLKPETADNVDVLIEHYLNPFGAIQAGFFYKNLNDPIVTQTVQASSFPGQTGTDFRISQPINAGSAWVYGFEASYIQHLTFLPGFFRGFGISANYGYTNSEASGLPGRSDHPRLARSAPHTWNVSPTFDYKRFAFRAGLSYNAANIFEYQYQDGVTPLKDGTIPDATPGGLKGPNSDTYFYPHLQIDMQGSVGLGRGLTFVAYILNVNNEVFGFYNGSSQYLIQREYYKPTYAAGFRWNPTFEKR